MSAASVPVTGSRRLLGLKPATSAEATMLTATKAIPTIVGIIIANNTGGAIAATMRWGNGSTDYDVLAAKSVAANDSYINNDVYLPLREGHTIKVTSATGNALTFTLVIVETGSALPNVSGR